MEMQNSEGANWREEVSDSSKAVLKIADGEVENIIFLNEGEKRIHQDYGTSIVFEIEHQGEPKIFYVNAQNYTLLKQIKDLGKITGTTIRIKRKGKRKSDTRYTIEKVESKTDITN